MEFYRKIIFLEGFYLVSLRKRKEVEKGASNNRDKPKPLGAGS